MCNDRFLFNVVVNFIFVGCDLIVFFFWYFFICRGGYIVVIIGICMNFWLFYMFFFIFSIYFSVYGVFFLCIVGLMIIDYWFVWRGYMCVNDLYFVEKSGWYWYIWGINWCGYLGYIIGFVCNVFGFINFINFNIYVFVGV